MSNLEQEQQPLQSEADTGARKQSSRNQEVSGCTDQKMKAATRVFKKSSPNNKVTVYLGKRDFVDHLTHVDPIDGVVLIDRDYVKDRKVFTHVLAAFRYGREDLDVLGLTFRKDLYISCMQVYPPAEASSQSQRQPSRLQERLIKKLGPDCAFPFFFELPPQMSPASVTLQPGPSDSGKPCGVDYELKTYVAESAEAKSHKRSTVRLAIRKLTYAAVDEQKPPPSAEATKEFMMSSGSLRLEASLDKDKYYHGESISINVLVDNNTHKTVKRVKISVRQIADICLFSPNSYKCSVADLESDEGFPIGPAQTGWCKVYHLCPLLANNRDKRGLALDGQLKHEDTNLASSTILGDAEQTKENLGIIVNYQVKVRLVLGFAASDVSVELPFVLTHPKPPEEDGEGSVKDEEKSQGADGKQQDHPGGLDPNLIHLDTDAAGADEGGGVKHDDDLIFEEFSRLRLTAATDVEA